MKSGSWKKKIDPAFPKFIRFFLRRLEESKLSSNNGYVYLSDIQLKEMDMLDFPAIADHYESYEAVEAIIHTKNRASEPVIYSYVREYAEAQRAGSASRMIGAIYKIIDALNEKSRTYYMKYFKTDEIHKDAVVKYMALIEERNEPNSTYNIDLVAYELSLIFHAVVMGSKKNAMSEEDSILEIIPRRFFFVWNAISILLYRKDLALLYSEAKDGNDKSLYNLLQIDKTLFDHEWVRVRIRKAMYSGDKAFFKSIAKSIRVDPLTSKKTRITDHLVLAGFWDFGLYRLTVPELMELFDESGIYMGTADEVSFRKFYDRFKKLKPRFDYLQNIEK